MKHFLIIYDRTAAKLLELREFSDSERDAASAARLEADKRTKTQPNIEVVILTSDSLQTIKKTHAGYFKTIQELILDMMAELELTPHPS